MKTTQNHTLKDKVKIHGAWKDLLISEFEQDYMLGLRKFLKAEVQKKKTIYPPGEEVFNALNLCPFEKVKVVILGQDPYHGPKQAHGLSFSVKPPLPPPPSLKNIYKELQSDLGIHPPSNGNLTRWAEQGVLLLNATLTVEKSKAGSHQGKGWEEFTDKVIHLINEKKQNVVFLLWGSYAQKKGTFIDQQKHLVLKAPHPSPLSAHRGFLGCKHFSKTNAYLKKHGLTPIKW